MNGIKDWLNLFVSEREGMINIVFRANGSKIDLQPLIAPIKSI